MLAPALSAADTNCYAVVLFTHGTALAQRVSCPPPQKAHQFEFLAMRCNKDTHWTVVNVALLTCPAVQADFEAGTVDVSAEYITATSSAADAGTVTGSTNVAPLGLTKTPALSVQQISLDPVTVAQGGECAGQEGYHER